VRRQADEAWEKELGNIRIDATKDQKTIFYTGLYHAYTQPNQISDLNGEYMKTDFTTGKLSDGDCHYSTFSLWDTFRAAHPLYTLLKQDRVAGFVNSMIRQYDTYGYLPIWQLWGTENYCMIGNHAIPVLVDAALKHIPGIDINKVYEAVKGSSMREHLNSPFKIWEKYGYMPEDLQTQSVSITLEMAYNDACVARLAKYLGKTEDYEHFNRRAHFYRNLFDKSTGFFHAKNSDGKWLEPFDPMQYGANGGNPFTEANAWQYLWYVPQDVPDFISLFGGAKNFEKKLDAFFTTNAPANAEKNGNASGFIGQYAHGNEPSHHIAYLYDYVGKPEKGAYYANKVMNEQYLNRIDGYSGNEDCGQMSSWYIWSSMGFYPTDPASGRYDFGSPQFKQVTIDLPNGKQFVIKTNRQGRDDYKVKRIQLNGRPVKEHFITHDQIMAGGTLVFTMTK
jgi:predicted alpha-1,2-mannosidase